MNNIMTIRESETRLYASKSNYFSIVKEAYDRICYWFPNQVDGRPPIGTYHHVAASDFWVRGLGEQSKLADKWKITLPADYLEFCSNFKTYTIVGRNSITILDALEIEKMTQALRCGEDVADGDPYCLYRFAMVEACPWHFMFRYSDEGVFLDVAFAAYTDADEWEILGENEARYFSDHSFSDWLKRMIETDCVPLRHNFQDEFEDSTQRILPSDG
jgi:hypothetical protein